jgi:nucleotide-binding universal stress UspA family protein
MCMTNQATTTAPGGIGHDVASSATRGMRFLAVVDGSERTNRIVDFVASIAQGKDSVEAIILNVQDRHYEARLRGYQSFKKDEIEDRLINDVGLPIVNAVSKRLGKVGVVCLSKVKIGDPLPIILRCAAEDKCDVIVLADPQPQYVRRWVRAMGLPLVSSLLSRVITAALVPVVIVK